MNRYTESIRRNKKKLRTNWRRETVANDSFLSVVGTFIIVLSIGGFLYGMYEAIILASVAIGFLSFAALIFGVYNGYLGVVVQSLRGGTRSTASLGMRTQPQAETSWAYSQATAEGRQKLGEARLNLLLESGFSTEEIEKVGDLGEMTGEQLAQIIARREYHHS